MFLTATRPKPPSFFTSLYWYYHTSLNFISKFYYLNAWNRRGAQVNVNVGY